MRALILLAIFAYATSSRRRRSLDAFLDASERSNVIAKEMGLLRSQQQPPPPSQQQEQTFEDYYERNRFASVAKGGSSASKSGKSGKGGTGSSSGSTIGCCRLCPEQFEGIDVIPTQSFLETKETTTESKAGKSGKGGSGAAPPPPPVPLTIEQLIAQTPCCPVCLEQFDPPVDIDDASFLEISEKFVMGSSAKAPSGTTFKCCTMCPNDSVLPGTFEASGFLETQESVGKASKAGSTGGGKDTRMNSDGCCNQCPASMFESAEVRFQEPQGGPFGLKPRVKSVSSAFPLQQPPVV